MCQVSFFQNEEGSYLALEIFKLLAYFPLTRIFASGCSVSYLIFILFFSILIAPSDYLLLLLTQNARIDILEEMYLVCGEFWNKIFRKKKDSHWQGIVLYLY